jgi:hypothetical protein
MSAYPHECLDVCLQDFANQNVSVFIIYLDFAYNLIMFHLLDMGVSMSLTHPYLANEKL